MTEQQQMQALILSSLLLQLAQIILLSVAVIIFSYNLGSKLKEKRPPGVIILGALLMLGSIYSLWGILDFDYYRFMFQQLPEPFIWIRYVASIIFRLVSLTAAVGVLLLKDIFRKLAIGLGLWTLATLYWKHPFYVFNNIYQGQQEIFLNKNPIFPWIALGFYYAIDIIFSISFIYYFTRPKVKAYFK